jgi:hypothetical protein
MVAYVSQLCTLVRGVALDTTTVTFEILKLSASLCLLSYCALGAVTVGDLVLKHAIGICDLVLKRVVGVCDA